MTFVAKEKSSFNNIVVLFVVLILFLFVFFLFMRSNKVNALKQNTEALVNLQEDYSKIDNFIYLLYEAESNSRLYEATADKRYIREFLSQIQTASALLGDLDAGLDKAEINELKNSIKQKKLNRESYLEIRKLTDSLIVGVSKLGLVEKQALPKGVVIPKKPAKVQTIVHMDTVRKYSPRKKFLGRLFSSSNSKDSLLIVRREEKKIVRSEVKGISAKQRKILDAYYSKLYSTTNKLKPEEIDILFLNHKLIAEIIADLQLYKKNQIGEIEKNRTILSNELSREIRQLDRISVLNALLLLSLVGLIIYNVFKLYRNEQLLITLTKRSSQEVHLKSRFLANMSHELRTPLNSVIGFSEQLGKSNLGIEQKEQVRAIRRSSEMLLELVNEILDFSKYEIGKGNFEVQPFHPLKEIKEVFNSMHVLAENKNIQLVDKVVLDKKLCLTGDRLRLKQVVMNLLTNAIKFTADGEVRLSVQFDLEDKQKGVLKVRVEDTGIGIVKKDLDYIFDEFYQSYSSSRSKQQGTGLGLAICKKIVELQGGKIEVSSVVDKGSVFSFEIPFPIVEETEKAETPPDKKAGPLTTLAGKRILLVDDNKMNVLLAQTILKKWEMIYDSAYDGKEALDLFKNNEYDLVLTDIQMPVMGGVELTHEIRYNGGPEKSGIPILGITAHVLQENRDAYLKVGMNDLVLKPFLEKELIDKIKKYI
ncbi:ATP-binding protein [Pedobacter nutrimenti]|uniref:ATP-binding protein n=1 Tax=Pedobacter nutrimenti TaxID=1241337 RepID=UPI00292E0F58|nr:ATP-binding protein [Pedobacter nutrimenti]